MLQTNVHMLTQTQVKTIIPFNIWQWAMMDRPSSLCLVNIGSVFGELLGGIKSVKAVCVLFLCVETLYILFPPSLYNVFKIE